MNKITVPIFLRLLSVRTAKSVSVLIAVLGHLRREDPRLEIVTEASYRPRDTLFRAASPHLDETFIQPVSARSDYRQDFARSAQNFVSCIEQL